MVKSLQSAATCPQFLPGSGLALKACPSHVTLTDPVESQPTSQSVCSHVSPKSPGGMFGGADYLDRHTVLGAAHGARRVRRRRHCDRHAAPLSSVDSTLAGLPPAGASAAGHLRGARGGERQKEGDADGQHRDDPCHAGHFWSLLVGGVRPQATGSFSWLQPEQLSA